jgi:hypothetical protein
MLQRYRDPQSIENSLPFRIRRDRLDLMLREAREEIVDCGRPAATAINMDGSIHSIEKFGTILAQPGSLGYIENA